MSQNYNMKTYKREVNITFLVSLLGALTFESETIIAR